ncbi:hypothetical protein IFM47457_11273 [Aspergillus lentulus]|nr:hypothetical protein IFM47457_11273 [Aspergillus lentulus]
MAQRHRNPLHNLYDYATPQLVAGPPATYAAAQRMPKRCGGCVLASKLSEDPHVSVLLLEAGGDDTALSEAKVPLLCSELFHTKHDWNYYTVEQPNLAYRSLY